MAADKGDGLLYAFMAHVIECWNLFKVHSNLVVKFNPLKVILDHLPLSSSDFDMLI